MHTTIKMEEPKEQTVITTLATLLADEFVLYTKTKNAFWNIQDVDFFEAPPFFETQCKKLDKIAGTIAEHIRQLGHYAPGTLNLFLQLTHLTEVANNTNNKSIFYLNQLLIDHESIIIHCKENVLIFESETDYSSTINLIKTIMVEHEKMVLDIRTHLK